MARDMNRLTEEDRFVDHIAKDVVDRQSRQLDSEYEMILKGISNSFAECFNLIQQKNRAYTGEARNNFFHNFIESGEWADVGPDKALRVQIGNKIARLKEILLNESLPFDGVEENAHDAINYIMLLLAWRRQCKQHDRKQEIKVNR